MTCVHLKELYRLCQTNGIALGSSDVVRIACRQCGEHEVCPSILTMEYDAREVETRTKPVPGDGEESSSAG